MNEDITTETLSAYEQACSQCIDDLYHVAYLALVDADMAEDAVKKVCVAGLHKYGNMDDTSGIRVCLTSALYGLCRRKLMFFTPSEDALPESLRNLTKQERLIAAMRFESGLSADESGAILGFSHDEYARKVSQIVRKKK